jgi:hypothetical protein
MTEQLYSNQLKKPHPHIKEEAANKTIGSPTATMIDIIPKDQRFASMLNRKKSPPGSSQGM